MRPFDPYAYTITIRRVKIDGEYLFQGVVQELPHLAAYEPTPPTAYYLLIDAIRALHEDARRAKLPFPQPAQ